MDLSGRNLDGKYDLIRLLGRGGFGAVYLATQRPLGREVAVKTILSSSRAGHANLRTRFFCEARVLGRLRHPSNTTLLDYGETDDGLLFMVQEYIAGQTLKDEMKQRGTLDARRAARIACQVLAGLGEAHHHGVVHRDIKPANVMLTADFAGREQVKLLDFGIAKLLEDDGGAVARTGTGLIIGTPSYMAPEQIREEPLTPAADLYAVGALLHTMLIGRPPFHGLDRFDLYRRAALPPLPLRGIARPLADVIRRALSVRPADRFSTAGIMEEALGEAMDGADTLSTLELPPDAIAALHGPPSVERTTRPGRGAPDDETTHPDSVITAPRRMPGAPRAGRPEGPRITSRLAEPPPLPPAPSPLPVPSPVATPAAPIVGDASDWPSMVGAPPTPKGPTRAWWVVPAALAVGLAIAGFVTLTSPGEAPAAADSDDAGTVRIRVGDPPSGSTDADADAPL